MHQVARVLALQLQHKRKPVQNQQRPSTAIPPKRRCTLMPSSYCLYKWRHVCQESTRFILKYTQIYTQIQKLSCFLSLWSQLSFLSLGINKNNIGSEVMCQERQRDTHSTGSGGCDPVMAGGETQLTARRKAEWWGVPS